MPDTPSFDGRLMISKREGAAAIGVSLSTFQRLLAANEIKSATVGRRRLVGVQSLLAWVAAHTETGQEH
jgi:excisionase family DNA binding protein